MCMQYAQYVLLFLVLVVNSDQFQILQSYTLLLALFLGSPRAQTKNRKEVTESWAGPGNKATLLL